MVSFWKKEGLLREIENNLWRFNYRIVPYDGLLFLTSRFDRNDPDFTFLSYDSLCFASFLKRKLRALSFVGERGIDLCCGVGIQAITISPFCHRVIGTDINRGSVDLAKSNASFNDIQNCDFMEGSLFEKSKDQFDLIISNPPFINFGRKDKKFSDSNGGEPFGLGVALNILSDLDKYLTGEGKAFIITRSPMIKDKDYAFIF